MSTRVRYARTQAPHGPVRCFRKPACTGCVCAALAVLACLAGTSPAHSATFEIADGDTNGLIAAIHLANSNGEADVINLATNGVYTLSRMNNVDDYLPSGSFTIGNGLPVITSELILSGRGSTIKRNTASGTPNFRILQIGRLNQPAAFAIHHVVLENGRVAGRGAGIAVYVGSASLIGCTIQNNVVFAGGSRGGGLFNIATLVLEGCVVSGNQLGAALPPIYPNPGPGYKSFGIYNAGALDMRHCSLNENDIWNDYVGLAWITSCSVSDYYLDGICNTGTSFIVSSRVSGCVGGIVNTGTMSLIKSEVMDNREYGIWNSGTIDVYDTAIRRNHWFAGQESGGGIINVASTSQAVATITSCLISENTSQFRGGGVTAIGSSTPGGPRGEVNIVNSTISDNYSIDYGGGVRNHSSFVALVNATVANNYSGLSGSGIAHWPIGAGQAPVTILQNSITTNQLIGADCDVTWGVIQSLGHNLDSDGTCNLDSNGDIPFGFANLGPLQDNGGPTWTHALLPGSDAIDAGADDVCSADPVNGVDQRGMVRPQGAACDIGAFEVGDFDGDGVIDGVDLCLSPPGDVVNPVGGPMGDIDDDCAVTLEDFFYFEVCLYISGPGESPLFPDCVAAFDFDADGDIDLRDYAAIQPALGG